VSRRRLGPRARRRTLRGALALLRTPSVELLSLKLNNSTLARGTSGYAPGNAARAPAAAHSLPSMMQFAPHNTARATRTTPAPAYGMSSGPLSVNAVRNSRIAPSACVDSVGQVIDFVHAVAANWAVMSVLFSNSRMW
jgi:hypothetical protein